MNRQVVGVFVVNGPVTLLAKLWKSFSSYFELLVNQKEEFSGISSISVNRLAASVVNGTQKNSLQYASTKSI